jgi:hypothetical protein
MTSGGVTVLDIIMNEGEVVQELDARRRRQGVPPVASNRLAGKQAEDGPESLSQAGRRGFEVYVDISKLVPHHADEALRLAGAGDPLLDGSINGPTKSQ